jgi:hypothetical protein
MALPLPHGMRLFDWRFSPDGTRIFLLPSTGQVFEWHLAEIRGELAKLGLNWK